MFNWMRRKSQGEKDLDVVKSNPLSDLQELVEKLEREPRIVLVPTTKTKRWTVDEQLKWANRLRQSIVNELHHRDALKGYVYNRTYDHNDAWKDITVKNLDTLALKGWLMWIDAVLPTAERMHASGAEAERVHEVIDLINLYCGATGESRFANNPFPDVQESPWENLPVVYHAHDNGECDAIIDSITYTFNNEIARRISEAKRKSRRARFERISDIVLKVSAFGAVAWTLFRFFGM